MILDPHSHAQIYTLFRFFMQEEQITISINQNKKVWRW